MSTLTYFKKRRTQRRGIAQATTDNADVRVFIEYDEKTSGQNTGNFPRGPISHTTRGDIELGHTLDRTKRVSFVP